MKFKEWYQTHWKWGSSTDEPRARRAWNSAREELIPLLTRAADALHWDNPLDHHDLIAQLRKAAE